MQIGSTISSIATYTSSLFSSGTKTTFKLGGYTVSLIKDGSSLASNGLAKICSLAGKFFTSLAKINPTGAKITAATAAIGAIYLVAKKYFCATSPKAPEEPATPPVLSEA